MANKMFLINLLVHHNVLLLFIVAALGYSIGRIKFMGASIGVAAVLFVGLAAGALHPDMKLPSIILELGLVLFVYTIGLASGPAFVASLTREGLRHNLMALAVLCVAAAITYGAALLLHLQPGVAAGLFAGSLTNTPALAAVIDSISGSLNSSAGDPTLSYSVAYPMGVMGVIFVAWFFQKLWKINYHDEAAKLKGKGYAVEQEISNVTFKVTAANAADANIGELIKKHRWRVVFSRILHNGEERLVLGDTTLQRGDLVSVIGDPVDVKNIVDELGEQTERHLEADRSHYDFRRIFVSKPALAGMRISDLKLPQTYGAIITLVRRGDVDLLANANTVLDLGDRVRVVAPRNQISKVSSLFGDSYRSLSEIDLLSLGVGIVMGLLLGQVSIPFPGGTSFSLGNAGGPLIVGLILGTFRRTGPITWTLPYSVNLTVRQIGLILLLACIGMRSGFTFFRTLSEGQGWGLFVAGMAISCITAFLTLLIGYKLLRVPFSLLLGMLSGIHTQPGVLGFAVDQSKDDLPNTGYALMYPVATIGKIILAQMLLHLLEKLGQ